MYLPHQPRISPSAAERRFWDWFRINEEVLFHSGMQDHAVMDRLATELECVHSGLTFEIGRAENGIRELVVSADGIKDCFPSVISLVDTAPHFPRWKFVKFRQRGKPFDIQYEGVRVVVKDVLAACVLRGSKVDIALFIPGYNAQNDRSMHGAGFILLDRALGEFDAEMLVGAFVIYSREQAPPIAFPFTELPRRFDLLATQIRHNY